MAKSPPSSKTGRLVRLGGLTSRVSGSYVGQRIKGVFQDEDKRARAMRRLHLDNAERVVETMGALKGAAMKVGQSIALVADGMDLPPEVAKILGKLNNKADPIPWEVIKEDIEAELERPLEEVFSWVDPVALGTASLAQAHVARLLDGTEVVVKVLHRGIEGSVDSDLAALKRILVTGRVLKRDKAEIDAVFDEIKARLEEELDYFQEAANLEYFHQALSGLEGVEVPKTHPSLCTARVLTMDRIEGESLDDFLEHASPEAKHRAGTLLAKTFHEMFYRLRALHADPHGGNYLFRPDGGIGIVDFGCVKRFDAWWVADYAQVAHGGLFGNRALALEKCRELEILVGGDAEAEDLLWEICTIVAQAFPGRPYTCGGPQDTVIDDIRKLGPRILRRQELRSPAQLVYLHRTLGGIYGMLRRLRHSYDYRAMFAPYAAYAIGVAEGRVDESTAPPIVESHDA